MAFGWCTFEARVKYWGLLLVIGILMVGCNRTNTATSTPIMPTVPILSTETVAAIASATVAVPATIQATTNESNTVGLVPTVTSTPNFAAGASTAQATVERPGSAIGIASQGAIFTSPRYSYTVVLPCCWLALPTPGTAMETALAELEADKDLPVWGDLGEQVRERATGAVMELIALLPDEENAATPLAQLTVSVLPTHGLTLDDYLTATEDELNSIANTHVLTAYIESTLGVGTLPASLIEYTFAPTLATTDDSEQTIAGLQVAFFGHDADTLIVLTFATTIDRFTELEPEFLHIVRTVILNDPAV